MKKAQVWQLDFFIAVIVSTLALVLFINFALNHSETADISDLSLAASSMSEALVTQGLPADWNMSTIRSIGLLGDSNRINNTKLFLFYNMTDDEYRVLLSQRHLYKIQLLVDNTPLEIANKTYVGFDDGGAESAFSVSRYLLYNDSIAQLEVIVWE